MSLFRYIHVYDHNDQTSSSLKPLGQLKPNFIWSIVRKRGMKVCIKGQSHITKMAAMAINSKTPLKIFFSRTRRPMILKRDMKQQAIELYKVNKNLDPNWMPTARTT